MAAVEFGCHDGFARKPRGAEMHRRGAGMHRAGLIYVAVMDHRHGIQISRARIHHVKTSVLSGRLLGRSIDRAYAWRSGELESFRNGYFSVDTNIRGASPVVECDLLARGVAHTSLIISILTS
jgi:hypothetical protein